MSTTLQIHSYNTGINEIDKIIKLSNVRDIISNIKNKFFTVCFVKKDNTTRIMHCQKGVHKYIKGTQQETTAKRKNTLQQRNKIIVHELNVGYRTINLESIKYIKCGDINIFTK